MISSKCALCEIVITQDNDTKEHIIPNAIGGKKRVNGFICKKCNMVSGDKWESELAKQLNPLSLLFSIKRDRGVVPSQRFETKTGEKLILNVDGTLVQAKPVYTEKYLDNEDKININIQARDEKEAKNMLKGVKKKYPKFDIETALSRIQTNFKYCSDTLDMSFSLGGAESNRSMLKSVLALAVHAGVPVSCCTRVVDYLNNEKDDICFGYFYQYDLILNRPEGLPLHCVSVKACSKRKQIIGYIEYFGIQRLIVCLSNSYEGDDISSTYAIDLISGNEIALEVDLDITKDEVQQAVISKKFPSEEIESAFHTVMHIARKNDISREFERLINRIFDQTLSKYDIENNILTEEQVQSILDAVQLEIKPFIRHIVS